MDKKAIKILNILKGKSVFETSKNGDSGHVIWSDEFYNLAKELSTLISPPSLKQKNMKEKSIMAKKLKSDGYSFREIMKLMGYKSPRSIQLLLKKEFKKLII
jgi:hypothetical protein